MTEPLEDGGAERKPGVSAEDAYVGDYFVWITRVRDDHSLPTLALAVAFTIAQHFDRKTRECWPGLLRIAELVGRDEKNVRTAIKALVKGGHLVIAKHRGGGGSTHYQMPPVNRAKSPGPLDGETSGERAKSPGPHRSGMGSERAKSPGPHGARNKAERAKSPGRSGQKCPPNQPQEPISKESAAAQPPRGAGEGEFEKKVRPEPFLEPEKVVTTDPRRTLDATWAGIVGPELAGRLGSTEPLHRAIASGEVTAEDVEAGIREGLAKGDSVPGSWRWFSGWARGAAKARAAGRPSRLAERDELAWCAPVPPGMIEFSGGMRRTEAFVLDALEQYRLVGNWDQYVLDFPPDSPFTKVPTSLLAQRLEMVTLKNGHVMPRCAAEKAARDFRLSRGREWDEDYFGDIPGTPGCLLPDDLQAEALRPRDPPRQREEASQEPLKRATFS